MSDAASTARGGRWTVRRAILAILGFQIGMAVILAGSDLIGALPQLLSPSPQPALDLPVRPGDQTRRYRPADLPARDDAGPADRISLPDPADMPARLRFERLAAGQALLTGSIAPGDAARFDEWLATQAGIATLRLHSPGGSVYDALAIGRAIRAAGQDTVMEAGDICLSACPYIFVGGVARAADPAAMIGVHQHYFGENTVLPAFLAVEDVQRGQAAVLRHLVEMGVDPRLMQHSLETPPDEIYLLVAEELEKYGLLRPADAVPNDADDPSDG
jgi:hypothetical protein